MQPNMNSRERLYSDAVALQSAIDNAFATGVNFYAYRSPISDNTEQLEKDTRANRAIRFTSSALLSFDMQTPGFVIAPFDKDSIWPSFVIPSGYTCSSPILPSMVNKKEIKPQNIQSTNKTDYLRQVSTITSNLKRSGGKVVLSRIICGNTQKQIANILMDMCNKYTSAFIFCFYTPFTNLWIGASPELLLMNRNGKLRTMSLAGTRPVNTTSIWDDKNLAEQSIVTQFISDTMLNVGIKPEISNRYTRKAGVIEHICNDITADLPANITIDELLQLLSPTPALSGYPQKNAMNMIRKLEKHDRSYYGGYVGISNGISRQSIYVNLRSVKIELQRFRCWWKIHSILRWWNYGRIRS